MNRIYLACLGLATVTHAEWVDFGSRTPLKALGTESMVSSFKLHGNLVVDIQVPGMDANLIKNKAAATFTSLAIKGAGITTDVGMPKLPVIRKLVEVDGLDAEVAILNLQSEVSVYKAKAQVEPLQASQSKSQDAGTAVAFALDRTAYARDEFFPNFVARIHDAGSIGGRKLAMLEYAPVQYNPASGEFRVNRGARLSINVGTKEPNEIKPGPFDSYIQAEVLGATPPVAANHKMLLIRGKGFEHSAALDQYIQWKRALGMEIVTADVMTMVTDADLSADSNDGADKVRAFVRRTYMAAVATSPISYVLLVGDVEMLPSYNTGSHYTDNYFAAVDKESYKEDAIYPDVAIGRFSVKTEAELAVVVQKNWHFAAALDSQAEWTKKIAFLATNDRYMVAEATHNYVIDTYTAKNAYSGIFPVDPIVGGDKLYAITNKAETSNVKKSVNDGRFIVSYSGHGAPTYWAGPEFDQNDIKTITNTEAKPYVMSHACVAGSFAMRDTDAFGETWLKEPNGGVAFWGTSNSSYWDEDDILERHFFDGMFKDNIREAGALNMAGLAGVREFYAGIHNTQYYFEIYNLLGDPSLVLNNK